MANKVGIFEYGQLVKLTHAVSPVTGRVVEWRGPLGPQGAQVYRVRLRRKFYVEVLESQLEPMPDKVPVSNAPVSV